MVLIRTLTVSTTAFERKKEELYGFRQTENKMYLTQTHRPRLIDVTSEWSELCEINRISRVSLAQGIARGVVLKEISGDYMCHT